MGPYRLILVLVPLMLATSALAQQGEGSGPIVNLPRNSTQGAPPDNRQGPELDVFRDPVTPTTAPTTTTPPPAVVLPPVVTPTAPPLSLPQPPTQTPAPRRDMRPPETRTEQTAPPTERSAPRRAETSAPAESGTGAEVAPTTPAPDAPLGPQNEAANAASAPAEPAPVAEVSDARVLWPWIAGGIVLLAGIAFFLLRRGRSAQDIEDDFAPAGPVAETAPPAPRPVAPPPPAPAPAPVPTPAPAPVPAPEAVVDATADRARIDLSLEVTGARNSLMGLTVGYTLTLSNRGERTAQDVLVRGLIDNAGGDQQALLQQFVSGQTGMPIHSAVAIAPGASQRLTGELRLTADQIAPVPMGERLLLIPLAAFDVQYRWGEENADPAGTGRTGGAFIIGQEQEPPALRLAPFRLDLGPRQYRRTGARVARQFGQN